MKTILFDLDGTLLPMDQDKFVKEYFTRLSKWLAPYGYDSKLLVENIWKGFVGMVQNNGNLLNEDVFWNVFKQSFGEHVIEDQPVFEKFYQSEFQKIKDVCGFTKQAKEVIDTLKDSYQLILATNPVFPRIATYSRIQWAGLDSSDFSYITTYENSHSCKPNLHYYQEILDLFSLNPEDCMMVGNDVKEDMVAGKLGMDVFLVTDCLINPEKEDISSFPHGSLEDLLKYLHK